MGVSTYLIARIDAREGQYVNMQLSSIQHVFNATAHIPSGTGDGFADLVWSQIRTVQGTSQDDIDLTALMPATGQGPMPLNKVKVVAIKNMNRTKGETLTIGNHPTSAWYGPFGGPTETTQVEPGGVWLWYDPYGKAVTPGTADTLRIDNQAQTPVTYAILILGSSA